MTRWPLLAFCGVLLVFAGLAMWLGNMADDEAPGSARSDMDITYAAAMAASFPDLNGQSQPLGQWQGKLLIINFWATWCAPCVEEMPMMDTIFRKNVSKKLQIVGIAADTVVKAREFQSRTPVSYPLLADPSGAMELSRRLGNRPGLLPHTVILAPDGSVILSKLGAFTEAELAAIVAENLPK